MNKLILLLMGTLVSISSYASDGGLVAAVNEFKKDPQVQEALALELKNTTGVKKKFNEPVAVLVSSIWTLDGDQFDSNTNTYLVVQQITDTAPTPEQGDNISSMSALLTLTNGSNRLTLVRILGQIQ